ncbi:hypothetical protein LINPERPRIM_LOCUS11000 [Linum perenne]
MFMTFMWNVWLMKMTSQRLMWMSQMILILSMTKMS